MQDHRVARRYASALFEAARQGDTVGAVEADLQAIVSLIRSNPDFRHFLAAPYASREDKLAFMERVFSDRVTALTMQLMRIMLEKRREGELAAVHEEFVVLRRAHESVAHVLVTSAEVLSDGERSAVVAKMESILRKRIEPDFQVDTTMIGGIRVKYENTIFDGSVRGALGRLKDRLQRDLLKQG